MVELDRDGEWFYLSNVLPNNVMLASLCPRLSCPGMKQPQLGPVCNGKSFFLDKFTRGDCGRGNGYSKGALWVGCLEVARESDIVAVPEVR